MKRITFLAMMVVSFMVLSSFTVDPQGDAKKPADKGTTEKKAKPKKKSGRCFILLLSEENSGDLIRHFGLVE